MKDNFTFNDVDVQPAKAGVKIIISESEIRFLLTGKLEEEGKPTNEGVSDVR